MSVVIHVKSRKVYELKLSPKIPLELCCDNTEDQCKVTSTPLSEEVLF